MSANTCSPGIDLPVASIMRTKYGEYPEYHTSLDNLDLVSSEGLQGSFDIYKECIELIERNEKYKIKCLEEPSAWEERIISCIKTISTKDSGRIVRDMMNFIAYADGKNDLIDISNIIGVPARSLYPIMRNLKVVDC